jgi:hypothetical protein
MTAKPWYREPWPWLLMAGPAIVVVAGIATTVLAVTSFDGMVADDYYKQGLGINRVIAREADAKRLGVTATLQFAPERSHVRVLLGEGTRPTALKLALVHPTLPAEDQSIPLAAVAPGVYEGPIRAPRSKALQVRLEDDAGKWRLTGAWTTRDDGVRLTP